MLAKTRSVAFVGTDARLVEIEVEVGQGLPAFRIVGLPAKSVQEADQRVRCGLLSSGQRWPPHRITANLAPGSLPKDGTHFDLPLAVGVVSGDGRLDPASLTSWIMLGEVGLDGSVRPVRGVLPAAILCRRMRFRGLICPAANAAEAAAIDGIEVVPVSTIGDVLAFLQGRWQAPPIEAVDLHDPVVEDDLTDVRGQEQARIALELAAAGGHNLLLVESLDAFTGPRTMARH